ncbi:MAG TPA: HIT family protein [Thermoanaerobaculia bacterium]|nr:HIT family protein [Thermoanaerobaculia bacterium]
MTESRDVIVAIHPFGFTPGYTLVMPREHIANIYDLPDRLAGPVLAMAARIARAAKAAFNADGITLRQNNDAASDQHLFHFHLHVIPRFAGDGDPFRFSPLIAEEEQEETASRLRAAL